MAQNSSPDVLILTRGSRPPGRGHLILLLRTILESEHNGLAALIDPIVCGVSACIDARWTRTGLRWIEAFDRIPLISIIQSMRELDLFSEKSLGRYFAISLRNKLAKIFEAAEASKPANVKAERKAPRVVTRVPGVERNIVLGLELFNLKSAVRLLQTYLCGCKPGDDNQSST